MEDAVPYVKGDTGTAWLVLSHAGWFTVVVNLLALATAAFTYYVDHPNEFIKPAAIGGCGVAILFNIWLIYTIALTCAANGRARHPVFGQEAFVFLFMLTAATLAYAIWLLVTAARL